MNRNFLRPLRRFNQRTRTPSLQISNFRSFCQPSQSDQSEPADPPRKKRVVKRTFLQRCWRVVALKPKLYWLFKKAGVAQDDDLLHSLATMSSFAGYCIAITCGLDYLGVNTNPFIAGFSVAGAAVGFASKDLAQNYIAGIFLLLTRTFQTGSTVTVIDGWFKFTGKVMRIDLRHLHLLVNEGTDQEKIVYVPNGAVFVKSIEVHIDEFNKGFQLNKYKKFFFCDENQCWIPRERALDDDELSDEEEEIQRSIKAQNAKRVAVKAAEEEHQKNQN